MMRDIPGYEGRYAATSCGKIWSHLSKRFLKIGGERYNYQVVVLSDKNHKNHTEYVHRLVAKAFLPNPENLPQVNHIDKVKHNNYLSNLEWCTAKKNLAHSGASMNAIKVYCIELDKTFPSIRQATIELNLLQSNLSTHLRYNTPKSVSGLHFQYAE